MTDLPPGTWSPFRYREFWDVPRWIVLEVEGHTLLLVSRFEAERDEYASSYGLLLVRDPRDVATLGGSEPWTDEILARAAELRRMPVAQVVFDTTRRRLLDLRSLGFDGESALVAACEASAQTSLR